MCIEKRNVVDEKDFKSAEYDADVDTAIDGALEEFRKGTGDGDTEHGIPLHNGREQRDSIGDRGE